MPKLRHPDGGPQVEVDADQVPLYEAEGWVPVAKKTSAKSGDEPAATAAKKE